MFLFTSFSNEVPVMKKVYTNRIFIFISILLLGAHQLSNAQSTPNAPTGLAATAGIGRVLVSFKAPSSDGGSTITNYQYSINDGTDWTTLSPASVETSFLIPNLNNCSNYNIKVRALNSVGPGTATSAVSVIPRSGNQTGINWTSRTSAANNNWYSVTYGNGMFVAVSGTGISNRVMTSPDGINWTSRISVEDNPWFSVTYGNGIFVAVANSGTNRVMTSPDGIAWTARTAADANSWRSVAYGGGLFVAVSQSSNVTNNVMTSTDGIIWTQRTTPANHAPISVTHGNGLFVAVTNNSNYIMTSPNGITWTARTAPSWTNWSSVTFGNGVFVAVSYGTSNVMTSTDGITWIARTASAANNWNSVVYGDGLFVAVSENGTNRVMTSPDGITWTARTAAAANSWRSVAYGNGSFVAVSMSGTNRVMTSFDALVPEKPSINNVTPGGTNLTVDFTAPTNTGTSAISNYEYSTDDGANWTVRSPISTSSPLTITGLTANTNYSVRLRAVNSEGSGCVSDVFSVLPVTWLSFTGKKVAQGVELNWSTSSEQNTDDFQVQHSINVQQWTAVGTLPAAGNSNTVRNYRFVHEGPFKASIQHYYRILQRDLDGKFSFSKIIRIEYPEASTDMVLYPNPANEVLRVNLTERQEIRLVNMQGVVVWKGVLPAGRHEIPVSNFATGNYILQTERGAYKVVID